jgi:predicted alpha/beta superfamily hydrolase
LKEIPDIVVVGVGYPNPGIGFKASATPRMVDLTPTRDEEWLKQWNVEQQQVGLPIAEGSGGAEAFLTFLRQELSPSIEQTYNVKHDDRALFGHSAGGLFATYVLFAGNGLFQRFIIGSPALWWNSRVIFKHEESFAAEGKALPARVFFSVGSLEQRLAPAYPMVADLQAFVDTLKRRNYNGLESQTHIFDDETHISVVPATISKGLRFIYPTPTPITPLQPTAGKRGG